jgi:hypothetical protein
MLSKILAAGGVSGIASGADNDLACQKPGKRHTRKQQQVTMPFTRIIIEFTNVKVKDFFTHNMAWEWWIC